MDRESFNMWYDDVIASQATDVDHLIDLHNTHVDVFSDYLRDELNGGKIISFSLSDKRKFPVSYLGKMPNSDFSPKSGTVNPLRIDTLPVHYEGILLWVIVSVDFSNVPKDKKIRLYGSVGRFNIDYGGLVFAGSSLNKFSLSCNIFTDDFPKIKETVEQLKIINLLEKGEKSMYVGISTKLYK